MFQSALAIRVMIHFILHDDSKYYWNIRKSKGLKVWPLIIEVLQIIFCKTDASHIHVRIILHYIPGSSKVLWEDVVTNEHFKRSYKFTRKIEEIFFTSCHL